MRRTVYSLYITIYSITIARGRCRKGVITPLPYYNLTLESY